MSESGDSAGRFAARGRIVKKRIDLLLFPRAPMQGQSGHKEEKYQHDAQLDKKQQNHSPELLLLNFEEMRRPGYPGIPEQRGSDKIEQGKRKPDDKCAEEKVPEENDLFVFHDRGSGRNYPF